MSTYCVLRSALSTFREGMEKAFGAAVDSGIPLSESLGLNPCSAAAGSSFLLMHSLGDSRGWLKSLVMENYISIYCTKQML